MEEQRKRTNQLRELFGEAVIPNETPWKWVVAACLTKKLVVVDRETIPTIHIHRLYPAEAKKTKPRFNLLQHLMRLV
jgi:hypothetical protein